MSSLLDTCPTDVRKAAFYLLGIKETLGHIEIYGDVNAEDYMDGVAAAVMFVREHGVAAAQNEHRKVERVWHRMHRHAVEQSKGASNG